MLTPRSLRITGSLLAAFLVSLSVLGVDSTGIAHAAGRYSDDPVVTPDQVVTYVDKDGQTRTVQLPPGVNGPKTTTATDTFKTGYQDKSLVVPKEQNPLVAQCVALTQEANPPLAGQILCGAVLAVVMATNALGFTNEQLIPSAKLDLPVNTQAIGCPVGMCTGGYYDKNARIWYQDPSEKVGFQPSPEVVLVGGKIERIKWGWRLKPSSVTSTVNFGSIRSVLYCSTGAFLTNNGVNADALYTSSTIASAFDVTGSVYEFKAKNAQTMFPTVAQQTAASNCVAAGNVLSLALVQGSSTVRAVFIIDPREIQAPPGMIGVKVTCTDAAGATTVITSEVHVNLAPGVPIDIPDTVCPAGSAATDRSIDFQGDGGGPSVPLLDSDDFAPVPGVDDALTENMECYDGTKACKLELRRSNGEPCGPVAVYCATWASDPNAETNYKCFYNSKAVSLNACSGFRAPRLGVLPNTDGSGNPVLWTDPPPTDLTEIPEEEVPSIGGPGTTDSTEGRDCFPTGWNVLNPVEWVMKPVGCAITKAFVPRQSVIDNAMDGLNATVGTSLFGSVATASNSLAGMFSNKGTTCIGPPFHLVIDFGGGTGMDETYHPLSACQEPMASVAQFSNIASGGIVLLGAGLASIRYFASIFGFIGPASGSGAATSSVRFKDNG